MGFFFWDRDRMIAPSHTIAIIGAGPAGLFAAEILSAAGCAVTIFDRKPSAARKFLMAGRGGLNITHSEDLDIFLTRYGAAQEFMTPLIRAFTPTDMRTWCAGLGQETFVGTSGRVFPTAMKSSPLLRAWLGRLATQGVRIEYNRTWTGWDHHGALTFDDGKTIHPDATLLALGGASWPGLGSDGTWAHILRAKNIPMTPFAPSNGGFAVNWSDYMREKHAGTPLKNIRLRHGDNNVHGEIMITQSGIEGGAVYALSASIRNAIARDGATSVFIDLHPHLSDGDIAKKLAAPRGRQSTSTFLRKTLNLSPLGIALLHESGADITAATIKSCPLTLIAPMGIDRAISSAGGIALSAINDAMLIQSLPGVFAAGEMLDWEAPTGGYLLQGCFATAHAAAHGILGFTASR